MSTIEISRQIDATPELVFETVADIRKFSEVVPEIVKVEFISEQRVGVGTRFRETRCMNGKEATEELEVTEYVPNERIRIVADSHGTVWDSVFTVEPAAGGTELKLTMEARAYRLLAKLMTGMMKGIIAKAIAKDMDRVKEWCESRGASTEGATP